MKLPQQFLWKLKSFSDHKINPELRIIMVRYYYFSIQFDLIEAMTLKKNNIKNYIPWKPSKKEEERSSAACAKRKTSIFCIHHAWWSVLRKAREIIDSSGSRSRWRIPWVKKGVVQLIWIAGFNAIVQLAIA